MAPTFLWNKTVFRIRCEPNWNSLKFKCVWWCSADAHRSWCRQEGQALVSLAVLLSGLGWLSPPTGGLCVNCWDTFVHAGLGDVIWPFAQLGFTTCVSGLPVSVRVELGLPTPLWTQRRSRCPDGLVVRRFTRWHGIDKEYHLLLRWGSQGRQKNVTVSKKRIYSGVGVCKISIWQAQLKVFRSLPF